MPEALVALEQTHVPHLRGRWFPARGPARSRLIAALAVAVFFAVWQLIGSSKSVQVIFISSPERVIQAGILQVRSGQLWVDLRSTALTYLIGLGLSIGIGIPLGILIGWYRPLEAVLDPYIAALMAAPRIVFFPLIIIWIGTGLPSIVLVVVLMCVFDVLVNTATGVRQLDTSLIRAARSFGASDRQIFTTLALPGAVPSILTGLRLAAGAGLIGVVVGELWIGQSGLGVMMTTAGQRLRAADIYFGVFILITVGLALTSSLERLERHFQRWETRRS